MDRVITAKYPLFVVLCVLSTLLCTTRSAKRLTTLNAAASNQDYAGAIKAIRNNPDLYGSQNQFLYWFDLGLLFHYTGQYDTSLFHLQKAEKVFDDLFAVSITNEAASIMTNDNIRPYRARRFEQVLLHQYLAFNYLAAGNIDEALVETRKVQLVFDRFQSKDGKKDKYNDDGMSHFISSILYDALGEDDNAAISLYKSVYAYQNGPVSTPDDVNDLAYYTLLAQERENDVTELGLKPQRDSAVPVPGLYADPQSEIILVGYSGMGPVLGETIFWGTYIVDGLLIVYYRNPNGDTVAFTMPAPPIPDTKKKKEKEGEEGEEPKEGEIYSGQTFHIKFALPEMVAREFRADHFIVFADTAAGSETRSGSLTDTDLLLRKDIDDNYSKIIARTALRVVLRTIASQKTKKELSTDQPLVNLLLNFGTDLLTDQLEKADTRLCLFLPHSIQIARIPVQPGTHRLEAAAIDNKGKAIDRKVWEAVNVKEREKKFIFYPVLK